MRFAPFSELVRFADDFSPDEFQVLDFFADMAATYDRKKSDTAKVVSIFTGKRSKVVPGHSAKRVPPVATTKQAVVHELPVHRESRKSAETNAEYKEVSYGR